MIDDSRSKLVNIVSGVPPQCFVSVIVPPVYLGVFFHIKEKLIGNADDPTLIVVVPSPGVREAIIESLNRDLCNVSKWCNLMRVTTYTIATVV